MTDSRFDFRTCTPADLGDLLRLQDEAFELIDDKNMLRYNSADMLRTCLCPPHVCLAAFAADRMAAFAILFVPDKAEDLAHDLDITNNLKAANLKLVIVGNAFRGMGLQTELMKKLEATASALGFGLLCCTCSPKNTHSLRNIEGLGYLYAKTITKYGGLERNLYYKIIDY